MNTSHLHRTPMLYQRDPETGAAISILTGRPSDSYPPIPAAIGGRFLNTYGYEEPTTIHGWNWSVTFNRWTALCTFSDGRHVWTYPDLIPHGPIHTPPASAYLHIHA